MAKNLAKLSLSFLVFLLVTLASAASAASEQASPGFAVSGAPVLTNPGFECRDGYSSQPGIRGRVPRGWTAALLSGNPMLDSTRIHWTGSCDGSGFVERLEGEDSMAFLSEDIETPPEPGKPFDAAIYQRVAVTPGTAYSLSGWMVSLCGGSAMPNDCPEGYYMAKLLGIDPTGGTNPSAPSVIWVEDRRNFTESRWANLRVGTTAQSSYLTVFARINSPFRWHGAHAFVDAYSLVRAPTARFVDLPTAVDGIQATIRWDGQQSPDIAAIPGGTYQLLFDVQVRRVGEDQWRTWLAGRPAGAAVFTADACAGIHAYEFRVRARSEQPEGSGGAWPNHRYPGDWSVPSSIQFQGSTSCVPRAYLPAVVH